MTTQKPSKGAALSTASDAAVHVPETEPAATSAADFRTLVKGAEQQKIDEAAQGRRAAALERQHQVKAILEQHVSEAFWRQLLQHAEAAASKGETNFLLLRFPSEVCSDGGRKIDVGEEGWEVTLRSEAAELFLRWQQELKPKGFGLTSEILSYENGLIGEIGLRLTWGK